jgi:hypothetical protein
MRREKRGGSNKSRLRSQIRTNLEPLQEAIILSLTLKSKINRNSPSKNPSTSMNATTLLTNLIVNKRLRATHLIKEFRKMTTTKKLQVTKNMFLNGLRPTTNKESSQLTLIPSIKRTSKTRANTRIERGIRRTLITKCKTSNNSRISNRPTQGLTKTR